MAEDEGHWKYNDNDFPWHKRVIIEGKTIQDKIHTLIKNLEKGDTGCVTCRPYYVIEEGDNKINLSLKLAKESVLTSDCPRKYAKDDFIIVTLIVVKKLRQGLGYTVMKELIKQSLERKHHVILHGPYNHMSRGLAEKLKMEKVEHVEAYYSFHYT